MRKKKPHSQRSVALLVETSNAYSRGLLSGIVAYMKENDPWSIYLPEQERGAAPPSWLQAWKGDGLIVRIENQAIASAIRKLTIPVIDVSAARQVPAIPWVETNDSAIAKLAADHFIERGFHHLAYCGDPDFNWSKWREEEFVQFVEQAGCDCRVFQSKSRHSRGYSMTRERRRLTKWVTGLPHPTGIFTCYDIKGQQILDVCRELEIQVPEQVAVLGVDNDTLLCDLCTPPLSSIIPAAHRTGREAARMLDLMMQGRKVPETLRIDPIGVVTRQSTDVLAIDDADIALAIRFIRDHACDGINVHDVLKVVPLSRRVMESRFQSILGRTPHEEITRRRVECVCQLLQNTDLTLAKIAEKVGYQNEGYMSVAFRRELGVSPGKYRKQI